MKMRITSENCFDLYMRFRAWVVLFLVLSAFIFHECFSKVIDIDMHPIEREHFMEQVEDRLNKESRERCNEGSGSERDRERADNWERDHTT